MTQLPFITNKSAASDRGEKTDSAFRSAGQTKQHPPRPHITTAKPQGFSSTKTKGSSKSK